MSLPDYAYTFTNIEAVNENRAKKRVIESLMRHYEEADPEIYLNNVEEVDIQIINKYIDDIIQKLNSLITYVYIDKRAIVQGLYNFIGDNQVSFKKTILDIESIIEKIENYLLDVKQKISNVPFKDYQLLLKKMNQLFSVYNSTYEDFVLPNGNIRFVDTIKDKERIQIILMILNQSMDRLEKFIFDIFSSYNERRRNLFTREEVEKRSKMEGGYYSTDDYKIDEYI